MKKASKLAKTVRANDITNQQDDCLISIVVPVYNINRYIGKCIESIIIQTYKALEIILVDDGSNDGSDKICDEYALKDSRITVIHKANSGLSAARNTGIKAANGHYITFIDGDDFIDGCYVEKLYDSIRSDKSDIATIGHRVVYPNIKYTKKSDSHLVLDSEGALFKILYDKDIDLSAWGKLYKTSLFNGVEFPEGRIFEDSATTYILFDKANKISVVPDAQYNYIIRDDSITNTKFNDKKMDLIKATEEMVDYISSKYPGLKKACNRRLMWAYLSTLSSMVESNNVPKEMKNRVFNYIKKHRSEVLADKNIQKRDRLALRVSYLGYHFYGIVWKLYNRKRRA